MAIDWESIASIFGYGSETAMLYDLYVSQRLSVQTIASKLDTKKSTVLRRLELCNIPRRSRGGANNKSHRKELLHLLDQRFVLTAPVNEVAHVIDAHPSTVWKYVRGE